MFTKRGKVSLVVSAWLITFLSFPIHPILAILFAIAGLIILYLPTRKEERKHHE